MLQSYSTLISILCFFALIIVGTSSSSSSINAQNSTTTVTTATPIPAYINCTLAVAIAGNMYGATNADCLPCSNASQLFWPCTNEQVNKCCTCEPGHGELTGDDFPPLPSNWQPTPAPPTNTSTTHTHVTSIPAYINCSLVVAIAGNIEDATNALCLPCSNGTQRDWPCENSNVNILCTCAPGYGSLSGFTFPPLPSNWMPTPPPTTGTPPNYDNCSNVRAIPGGEIVNDTDCAKCDFGASKIYPCDTPSRCYCADNNGTIPPQYLHAYTYCTLAVAVAGNIYGTTNADCLPCSNASQLYNPCAEADVNRYCTCAPGHGHLTGDNFPTLPSNWEPTPAPSTTPAPPTTLAPSTTAAPPATTTTTAIPAYINCTLAVAVQGNIYGATNADCKHCSNGTRLFWPCENSDVNTLCTCAPGHGHLTGNGFPPLPGSSTAAATTNFSTTNNTSSSASSNTTTTTASASNVATVTSSSSSMMTTTPTTTGSSSSSTTSTTTVTSAADTTSIATTTTSIDPSHSNSSAATPPGNANSTNTTDSGSGNKTPIIVGVAVAVVVLVVVGFVLVSRNKASRGGSGEQHRDFTAYSNEAGHVEQQEMNPGNNNVNAAV